MNFLGREDKPVKVYGWLQNSYTYNTNGRGITGQNFGVTPNNLANQWQGNQYYLIIENAAGAGRQGQLRLPGRQPLRQRLAVQPQPRVRRHRRQANHFNGYDLAQVYGEVHIPPVLSKGGTDIKGGRFYTILGYEVVPATGRPLLSVPYMFNYGQPFTHVGALATTHVTDRVNWYNGVVNGSDRWINENYKWNYLGGFTWTSKNGKANAGHLLHHRPEQLPPLRADQHPGLPRRASRRRASSPAARTSSTAVPGGPRSPRSSPTSGATPSPR